MLKLFCDRSQLHVIGLFVLTEISSSWVRKNVMDVKNQQSCGVVVVWSLVLGIKTSSALTARS